MKLTGLFVLLQSDTGYRTGHVIATLGDEYVLVRFDCMNDGGASHTLPIELVALHEIACCHINGERAWGLFLNRAELDKFVEYITTPPQPDEQPSVPFVKH